MTAYKDRPDQGVLTPGEPATPDSPDTLDKANIERLGRQRPDVLPIWFAEIAFVFTIVFSMMMSEYFISGFNVILLVVATTLEIPDSAPTWPTAVINLTTACLLLPFARIADRFGGRNVFLAGHVWLVIWSLISGFSRDPTMLIACRAMQGLDPGVFMPADGLVGRCEIVPGLVLVVFAFTDGGHAPNGRSTPYIYVTLIVGGLLLRASVYIQGWASESPLLPVEVLKPKYMRRLSIALFCADGVFGLLLFYASFYPLLTAAWFTPLAVGGMIIAITGGFLLHLLPNRLLMNVSQAGSLLSILLFALIPSRDSSGKPSIDFLYWAYVVPIMICGIIGIDITFNITNVFITTSLPARLQSTVGGAINSLLYLGMAFWLGVGESAVSTTVIQRAGKIVSLVQQYRIGFWTGVGLAGVALVLVATVRMGKGSAALTADEKAELERKLAKVPRNEAPAQNGQRV
ncbi:hypothetical protein DL770_010924 [Monosporascus sp. CRB-9-2]|nr:hypothetical protein DL770_010924 [Monosporascus sp. CRB-9-2]